MMTGGVVNNELERIRKEAVVPNLRNNVGTCLEELRSTKQILIQDSPCAGHHLK
jgi:hypothetical protein